MSPFLLALSSLMMIINSQDANDADLGCNYVNWGGVAMSTEYCMTINSTKSVQFDCNDDYTGITLKYWEKDRLCLGTPYTMDYSDNVFGFYCDEQYEGVLCDDVTLRTFYDDDCLGNYDEVRFITDECLINPATNQYAEITCTEDTAEYSVYTDSDCDINSMINQTVIHEGNVDGVEQQCIEIDGCYELSNTTAGPTTTSSTRPPAKDIGCNYMNFFGIGVPLDFCVQIPYDSMTYSVAVVCNDTYNGVAAEVWYGNKCKDRKGFFSEDLTPFIPEFYCSPDYLGKHCDTVTISAYQEETCSGDEHIEIDLIVDECLHATGDMFAGLTCTHKSATYSLYGDVLCESNTIINSTSITEGSYEIAGESIGCVKIDGCGDDPGTTTTTTRNPYSTTKHGGGDDSSSSDSKGTLFIGIGIGIAAVVVMAIIISVVWRLGNRKRAQIAHIQLNGGDDAIAQVNIDDDFVESNNNVKIVSSAPGSINSKPPKSGDDPAPYTKFDDNAGI